jgi:hypothetical protein
MDINLIGKDEIENNPNFTISEDNMTITYTYNPNASK